MNIEMTLLLCAVSMAAGYNLAKKIHVTGIVNQTLENLEQDNIIRIIRKNGANDVILPGSGKKYEVGKDADI